MVREQEALDSDGRPRWLRIILVILCINAIPLLALLLYILSRWLK